MTVHTSFIVNNYYYYTSYLFKIIFSYKFTVLIVADLCGIGEHYVNDLCAPCPIGSWGSDGITCRPCDSGTTTFKRGTTSHDGCIQVYNHSFSHNLIIRCNNINV